MTRREKQYKDSAQLIAFGWIGIFLTCVVLQVTTRSHKDVGEAVTNPITEEGNTIGTYPSHKEAPDPTGTTQGYTDEWVMWIGGDNDTIWE